MQMLLYTSLVVHGAIEIGTFSAEVGVEDSAGAGSIQFQILLDGTLKAQSPVMRPGGVHVFRVNVSPAKQIALRVLNGGDGHVCDHAAWELARFVRAAAPDRLKPSKAATACRRRPRLPYRKSVSKVPAQYGSIIRPRHVQTPAIH